MPVPMTYNELRAPGDGELWVSLIGVVLIAAALARRVASPDHHELLGRAQTLSIGLLALSLAHQVPLMNDQSGVQ
jgi:hypothetical protein